jgi:hypothetical protein
MNSSINFEYSPWLILVCILLGIGYAALLYFREKSFSVVTNKYLLYAMAIMRTVSITILAVLLLSPFLKLRKTEEQKPIVVLLQDNSESIKNSFNGQDSTAFKKVMESLKDRLSEKYKVEAFSIGDKVANGFDFGYSGKATNLSDAMEQISDRYFNQNLGVVVLASDGMYNQGINPIYTAEHAPFNIYTIALGDTTMQTDLRLAAVKHNKTAYLNEQIPLRIEIEASNLSGKQSILTVEEIKENTTATKLFTRQIAINGLQDAQVIDVLLPAAQSGISRYRIALSNLEGEVTYKNNVHDVFIEVLDGKQKILIVANAPHPDVSAIKSAAESAKAYQVDVAYIDDFTTDISEYNLVVLHQLPSSRNNAANIIIKAKEQNKSLLFVVGAATNINELNRVQQAININAGNNRFDDAAGIINKSFSLFTLSPATTDALPKLPPFEVLFGEYKSSAAAQVLLQQRINNVPTDYPLMSFYEAAGQKIGIIAGEGIWRWRFYDYLMNKNHNATNELISKSIQYLAVKADKRPFKVVLPKNIFSDNEPVLLDAQLLNANYELVNTPDVNLEMKAEDGKVYNAQFSRTENAYNANMGTLPVGSYSYKANTKLGNNTYTANGRFSISPLQLEALRTRADHTLLNTLAAQHGGKMVGIKGVESLAEEIIGSNKLKSVLYDTFLTESAINLKWIFAFILLLLTGEWFMRKYLGGY